MAQYKVIADSVSNSTGVTYRKGKVVDGDRFSPSALEALLKVSALELYKPEAATPDATEATEAPAAEDETAGKKPAKKS